MHSRPRQSGSIELATFSFAWVNLQSERAGTEPGRVKTSYESERYGVGSQFVGVRSLFPVRICAV